MNALSGLQWRPGIGDPTFMGWFTVAAYLLGAVLAGVAARTTRRAASRGEGGARNCVWPAVALLLALLAINKQLDLQSLFTDIGRVVSRSEGWYEGRREVQKWFVIGVVMVSATFAAWFGWRFREFWLSHRLLVCGLFFLMTFIVVRAVSFHHVDEFLGTRLVGVKMNWFLELTGISLIATASLREIGKSRASLARR